MCPGSRLGVRARTEGVGAGAGGSRGTAERRSVSAVSSRWAGMRCRVAALAVASSRGPAVVHVEIDAPASVTVKAPTNHQRSEIMPSTESNPRSTRENAPLPEIRWSAARLDAPPRGHAPRTETQTEQHPLAVDRRVLFGQDVHPLREELVRPRREGAHTLRSRLEQALDVAVDVARAFEDAIRAELDAPCLALHLLSSQGDLPVRRAEQQVTLRRSDLRRPSLGVVDDDDGSARVAKNEALAGHLGGGAAGRVNRAKRGDGLERTDGGRGRRRYAAADLLCGGSHGRAAAYDLC